MPTWYQNLTTRLRAAWRAPGVRTAVSLFIVLRLLLSGWALLALTAVPLPAAADETRRPYLDQPILDSGAAGALLGPWQRFDALRYTRIAAVGYANEEDSVFPPLFPLGARLLGALFGGGHAAILLGGILIANMATLALFLLVNQIARATIGPAHSMRTLLYLALFPTGWYLFAPYTESLFILLALASLWQARNGRFVAAGILGYLAALTRLTGWVLVVPLAYEFWRRHLGYGKWKIEPSSWRPALLRPMAAVLLPGLGLVTFMVVRWGLGLRPLPRIYAEYWYQTTGIPGADLLTALHTMLRGGAARAGELTLWFDFGVTLLLLITTALAFRRLGMMWGLYSGMLLLFMLLPTSELKPLYSFSRYALAFLPTFLLLAEWGKRPWVNRLILYPSIALYLYFSGQFFIWGWVA